MYDDERHQLRSSNSRESLKLPLVASRQAILPIASIEAQVLSPLALTTPDLESFITASTLTLSTSCTTPTPTTQILRNVTGSATSEQEEYAKGFVDALQRIRQQETVYDNRNTTATTFSVLPGLQVTADTSRPPVGRFQPPPVVNSEIPFSVASTMPSNASSVRVQPPVFAQPFNANARVFDARVNSPFPPVDHRLASLQAEQLQIVPGTPPPPLGNPLDPNLQEELKRRRKKERNRVAASKCRKRRLEKESVLEDHVKVMKQENGQLQAEVNNLRQVVFRLKQMVLAHVSGGCKVMKEQAGLDGEQS